MIKPPVAYEMFQKKVDGAVKSSSPLKAGLSPPQRAAGIGSPS